MIDATELTNQDIKNAYDRGKKEGYELAKKEYQEKTRQQEIKKLLKNPNFYKERYEKRKEEVSYKKYHKKANENYEKKYPEKYKAKIIAQSIEIKGLCEICKKKKAEHRHHPDYSKPLQVVLLCQDCHKEIHKAQKGQGCKRIFFPFGEGNKSIKESSWVCGDIWNDKILLCPTCQKKKEVQE